MLDHINIRKLRTDLGGVSQEWLARKLGVSFVSVWRWEQGLRRPSGLAREGLEKLVKRAAREQREREAKAVIHIHAEGDNR